MSESGTVVSAKDVKKLRDMTGAGMMECKRALMEMEGDIEKGVDLLRAREPPKLRSVLEKLRMRGRSEVMCISIIRLL